MALATLPISPAKLNYHPPVSTQSQNPNSSAMQNHRRPQPGACPPHQNPPPPQPRHHRKHPGIRLHSSPQGHGLCSLHFSQCRRTRFVGLQHHDKEPHIPAFSSGGHSFVQEHARKLC
ncbi:hypothetical protein ACFX12_015355 [Malus domestica]